MTVSDIDLAPHIEELKRALGENITTEKIEEELKKYFEYGIEVNEAKKAVIKKLGGNLNAFFKSTERLLADVLSTDNNIDVKVKVVSVADKTVNVRGSDKIIYYGLLADNTMIRPFTAWNDFDLEKDKVVHVHSAYVKDWRGEPQINFGNNTTVETLDDPELFSLDSSTLVSSTPSTEFEIEALRDGLQNISVTGRIMSVDSRTITVDGQQKEIYTGILADQTGKIAYTAWSDFELKVDEVIKVTGAYIRSWRGVPKLNFDERMDLKRLDEDTLPDLKELSTEQIIQIEHLLEIGGGMDQTVEGTILDIKEGSGLIQRCPECNRVLRNGECMLHGMQEGITDLRVKAVLDDGSGALMIVLNAEITAKLIGKTVEECELETKEKGPDNLKNIFNDILNSLLMHSIHAKGTVTTDDYGAMMICSDIEQLVLVEEVQARVKKLLDETNPNDWQLEVN